MQAENKITLDSRQIELLRRLLDYVTDSEQQHYEEFMEEAKEHPCQSGDYEHIYQVAAELQSSVFDRA
jgi:hypothetical protein